MVPTVRVWCPLPVVSSRSTMDPGPKRRFSPSDAVTSDMPCTTIRYHARGALCQSSTALACFVPLAGATDASAWSALEAVVSLMGTQGDRLIGRMLTLYSFGPGA